MRSKKASADALFGGGPFGEVLRAAPWSASVGSPGRWPAALGHATALVVGSPLPAFLWFGDQRTQVHNEALVPLLGAPALAVDGAEAWRPTAEALVTAAEQVRSGGEARVLPQVPIRDREGREAWFSVALQPLRHDGEVAGVIGWLHPLAAPRPAVPPGTVTESFAAPARRAGDTAPDARDVAAAFRVSAGRVLVATGDAELGDYLERLLSAHVAIDVAGDAASALTAVRELLPDLVLADARLPGMAAASLVKLLRTEPRTSRVPLLLLGPAALRLELLLAGADECIESPADPRELVAQVLGAVVLSRSREDAVRRERAARGEAESANRAKDEFLAMVSHELRSPLAAILIWTQLLRSESLEPATDRALGMIERSARTLTQIIDDLLDVSRIITGKLSLNPHPLDVAAVIDSAVSSAKGGAELKNVRLDADVDRTVPPVFGDPGRLQQVVANLLSNAIKFTSEDGRVHVRLDSFAGHARISVSDTGAGINPDFLPYIFERFRQADSTSTRTEKGLGLGLSIARHLVELHGGTIEAESAGEGRGSTFTVMLPLVPGAGGARDEPLPAATRTGGARELAGVRILLVDDDEDAREALAMLLTQWGADVASVGSAEVAFQSLRTRRPHVLLSDIAMPGEDGYSLIRRVRGLSPVEGGDVPAAALTAYATAEDRNRALTAGFQEHLAKPVDPDRLLGLMLDLARRARALHSV